MRILFLIGLAIVIVGALPMFGNSVQFIPTSGDNYQYTIIVLGALVALIGLFGSKSGERSKIAKMLGFKE